MAEQPCTDPPRKGGCKYDPETLLLDPELVPGDYARFTVALTREPSPALLPLLAEVRRLEVSWRFSWAELELPPSWTFWLQGLEVGVDDDLFGLQAEIARAVARGADHVLLSLAQEDPDPSGEYLHRLLGLIRSLCDEAGITFATVPGLKVNGFLASANCCRWPR